MDSDKPLLLGAALIVLMMVLVFLAGLMLGRGAKEPTRPAAPAPRSTTTCPRIQRDRRAASSSSTDCVAACRSTRRRRRCRWRGSRTSIASALRAYPMQPPTIPHAIDGYQVDKNSNRCMLCHARANAEKFQAPPVSVTHYMDRDDQFLATISPRRYFCNQCHVVQTDAPVLVANTFEDIDAVMAATAESKGAQ